MQIFEDKIQKKMYPHNFGSTPLTIKTITNNQHYVFYK